MRELVIHLGLLILCSVMAHVSSFSRSGTAIFMSNANPKPILQPKPYRKCQIGESWGKSPLPDRGQNYTRLDRKDFMRLQGRVRRLENLVHDLCCAIVYADDMALVEREMLRSGPIYQNPGSEIARPPILLRRETADIAWRYGNPVSPPAHKWH